MNGLLDRPRSSAVVGQADDHFRIDAVNLKHRLRNIDTDRATLALGRLPSMWFVSTQPPYGTLRCRRVGAVHHIIISVAVGRERSSIRFRNALKADTEPAHWYLSRRAISGLMQRSNVPG
jgi:hypothetical protein